MRVTCPAHLILLKLIILKEICIADSVDNDDDILVVYYVVRITLLVCKC